MVQFAGITSTIVSTNAAGPITVAYPSGILPGDALVLCIINTNPTTQATPTGWSASVQNSGTVPPGIGGNLASYVWEKTAVGTESGNVSSALGSGSTGIATMLRYTNLKATGPFGTSISTNSGASTFTTASTPAGTLAPAPLTTDIVVRFYTFAQQTANTTITVTNPGGAWVTRGAFKTAAASTIFQNALVVADKVYGKDDQTVNTNTSGSWLVVDLNISAGLASHNYSLNQAMSRAAFR